MLKCMEKLSWGDLELVLHVAEAGSVSSASHTLGVEQSTLSRRLDRLERRLGGSLFVRSRRGASVTPIGERLLPHARAAQQAFEAAQRTVQAQLGAVAGRVRIAMPEALAEHVFVPRLSVLRRRYPNLAVELVEGPEVSDLHNNEADLAVRLMRPERAGLVARLLARAQHGVYGHRDYCARMRGRPAQSLDWVSFGDPLAHVPEARWLARRGIEPALSFQRYTTILSAVRAGSGVCLVEHRLAALFDELEQLPLPDVPAFEGEVWLVSTEELRHAPHVEAAWNFAIETLREVLGDDPTLA